MNTKPQSELEWLFYNLWLKTGPAPPQFIFSLADTVFYRQSHQNTGLLIEEEISIPECWYFTSKEGYVLKKNRYNVSTKEIHKTFTKKMEQHDQVAAIAFYEDKQDLIVQHLPTSDFRAILFYSPAVNDALALPPNNMFALQKFIPSKQIKNTVYRCKYKGSAFHVEMLQNTNSLFDTKLPLDDRTPCFETGIPQNLVVQREMLSVPQQIEDKINLAVRQIRDHLLTNAKAELQYGVFYFKIDRKNDVLTLFMCNNIQIAGKIQPEACLGSKQEVKIHAWRKKLVLNLSSLVDEKLPEIKQAKRGSFSSRPQSNYNSGKQIPRIEQKQPKCPFCSSQMTDDQISFEITINQIIKLQNFFSVQKHSKTQNLDEAVKKSDFFSSLTKIESDSQISQCLHRLYPSLNYERLEKKKQDPNFLYENVKICEECYDMLKMMLPLMKKKMNTTGGESGSEMGLRNMTSTSLPQNQAQALSKLYKVQKKTEIINPKETDVSLINKRSINNEEGENADMRDILYSLNSRIPDQQQQSALSRQMIAQNSCSSVSRSTNRTRSGLDICKEIIQSSQKEDHATYQPHSQPMTMMFQKVEAGKQVAEQLVKIKVDSQTDTIKVLEKKNLQSNSQEDIKSQERIEHQILHKRVTYQESQLNEGQSKRIRLQSAQQRMQKVGGILPPSSELDIVASRKLTRIQSSKDRGNNYLHHNTNLLAQKMNRAKDQKDQVIKRAYKQNLKGTLNDWEIEYNQAIKAKTREVANEIFDACDKIESSANEAFASVQDQSWYNSDQQRRRQLAHAGSSSSILNIEFPQQLVPQARMFDNITPLVGTVEDHIDVNQMEQIKNLKKRSRAQPNNVRQNYHHEVQIKTESQMMSRSSAERVTSQSPNERKHSQKQKLLTAYGISFPKMSSAIGRTSASGQLIVGRIRPHSSKPQQLQQQQHPGYSTQPVQAYSAHQHQQQQLTNKPQTILQAYSEYFPAQTSDEPRLHRPRLPTANYPSKTASKPKPPIVKQVAAPTKTGGGGGLLDLENMTEEHVKQIACKADELIEIIKNIKAKVGGGGTDEATIQHKEVIIQDQGYVSIEDKGEENQNKDPNSWW